MGTYAESPASRKGATLGRWLLVHGVAVAIVYPPLLSLSASRGAASSQQDRGDASAWAAPRTPDGDPDLQGIWTYATATPLERPSRADCNETIGDVRIVAPCDLADRESLTDEEAAAFEARTREGANADRRDGNTRNELFRAYNNFWYDDRRVELVPTKRTSLILDPPDGRVPPFTPQAEERMRLREAERARETRAYGENGRMDGPEDRPLSERCLSARLPILPGVYNNNIQIVQGPNYVVIVNEMIHDARVIPLDGRRRVRPTIRQWMGDSIGRWEGDSLVIETTNFTEKTSFRGASMQMRLVERFTRAGSDTIRYRFTVDDPATWTQPWTAEFPMTKSAEGFFEFACHEGNYGLAGVLSGAREAELKRSGR